MLASANLKTGACNIALPIRSLCTAEPRLCRLLSATAQQTILGNAWHQMNRVDSLFDWLRRRITSRTRRLFFYFFFLRIVMNTWHHLVAFHNSAQFSCDDKAHKLRREHRPRRSKWDVATYESHSMYSSKSDGPDAVLRQTSIALRTQQAKNTRTRESPRRTI